MDYTQGQEVLVKCGVEAALIFYRDGLSDEFLAALVEVEGWCPGRFKGEIEADLEQVREQIAELDEFLAPKRVAKQMAWLAGDRG